MVRIKHLWRFRKAKVEREEIDLSKHSIFLVVSPDRRFAPVCAHCGCRILIHQHMSRVIRGIPLWDFSVFVEAHYRKGYCPVCRKIVVEHLDYTELGLEKLLIGSEPAQQNHWSHQLINAISSRAADSYYTSGKIN